MRAFQVDAFTKTRFEGNPAGVVLDADELSDRDMQQIAREFNVSETAFLLQPDADDHDVRIRFFTPSTEVPTCGHATVSAHYVRAVVGIAPVGRSWQKIGIGRLPVVVRDLDGDYEITMFQNEPAFGPRLRGGAADLVLSALGISAEDLDEGLHIRRVDTGNSKIIVPLKDRGALNSIKPNVETLLALNERVPNKGVYPFVMAEAGDPCAAYARMFAPQIGIYEDPVTGNGAGPLAAYLVAHGVLEVENGEARALIRQGEAAGRPGEVAVTVGVNAGRPSSVSVSGRAVIAFETTL